MERQFTEESRKRRDDAGRANLLKYASTRNTTVPWVNVEVDKFRELVLSEIGARPSMARRALAEAVVLNYNAILLLEQELRKTRTARRALVTERVSALTSTLARLLKRMKIEDKLKPKSLAEIAAANHPESGENDGENKAK